MKKNKYQELSDVLIEEIKNIQDYLSAIEFVKTTSEMTVNISSYTYNSIFKQLPITSDEMEKRINYKITSEDISKFEKKLTAYKILIE